MRAHEWERLDVGSAYCLNCPAVAEWSDTTCMNPFDFFDRKVCLTLEDIEWCQAQVEFARVGLNDYQKFMALPDIGPHQSFNKSTREILSQFWASGADSLLFLEDDCVFRPLNHLAQALAELPSTWDICYLGGNVIDESPERVGNHLFRVRACWATHCVAYRRRVVPFIIENQPGFSDQMYDNWLSDQLPNLNAFMVAPMCAVQRSHYSAIWQRPTDYSDVWALSDSRLA